MSRPRGYADEQRKKAFTKAVKVARTKMDIRQSDLAEVIGVQGSRASVLLNNPDSISVGRMRKIIEALDLDLQTVAGLLGYTPKQIRTNCEKILKEESA